jgi:hypothetical protein
LERSVSEGMAGGGLLLICLRRAGIEVDIAERAINKLRAVTPARKDLRSAAGQISPHEAAATTTTTKDG